MNTSKTNGYFEILGIPPDSPPERVKARWKVIAQKHHPDKGGDTQDWFKYQSAYRKALAASEKSVKCPECSGSGSIHKIVGWTRLTIRCSYCKGSGETKR